MTTIVAYVTGLFTNASWFSFTVGAAEIFGLSMLGFNQIGAMRDRHRRRPVETPPALQAIPEQNDYQENLEHKNNFRQLIKRDVNGVCEEANKVMEEIINKLRAKGGVYFDFARSLEYVLAPVNEIQELLNKVLDAEDGQLSNRAFLFLQNLFRDFFEEYQTAILWIRDAATHAGYGFVGSGNQASWRKHDKDMREQLHKFVGHPVFANLAAKNGSIESNLKWDGWWW